MAFVKKFFRVLKQLFKPRKSRRKKSRRKSFQRRKKAFRPRSMRRSLAVKKRSKAKARRQKPRKPLRSSKKAVRQVVKLRRSQEKKGAKALGKGLRTDGRARLRAATKAVPAEPQPGPVIGEITHYFSKIMVCVVKVTAPTLRVGEKIWVRGATTDFQQKVLSLQVQSVDVKVAGRGKLVGLKVDKPCRVGDFVHQMKA